MLYGVSHLIMQMMVISKANGQLYHLLSPSHVIIWLSTS